MSTRDRILDTFETILVSDGERGATLDAIAAGAGVSKGGLLYHFASKDALIDALLSRLEAFAAEDLAAMRTAPEGPSAYYVRTSVFTGSPIDRALIAATRLGQESYPRAAEALRRVQEAWVELIHEEVGDRAVARAIQLLGDGLYFNASLGWGGPGEPAQDTVEDLLRVVETLTRKGREHS